MRRTQQSNKIKELKVFNLDYDKELKYDFEVCYWRKCWGLRNDVLYLLGQRFVDKYEFDLSKSDVENIIKLLESYDAESWSGSIWDWDNEEYPYSEKIQRDIENLKILRELMDKYDLEVYFYDSY